MSTSKPEAKSNPWEARTKGGNGFKRVGCMYNGGKARETGDVTDWAQKNVNALS